MKSKSSSIVIKIKVDGSFLSSLAETMMGRLLEELEIQKERQACERVPGEETGPVVGYDDDLMEFIKDYNQK
jgi:hypothetical protein